MDNHGVGAWVEEDAAGYCRLFHLGAGVCCGLDCLSTLEDAAEYITKLEYSRRALMGAVSAVLQVAGAHTAAEAHALEHLSTVLRECRMARFDDGRERG